MARKRQDSKVGLVTVSSSEHRDVLFRGLWNLFLKQKLTDLAFKCERQSLRAHQIVAEIFLSPEKVGGKREPRDSKIMYWPREVGVIGHLLEFMYKGSVNVRRDRLNDLASMAEELEFQLLVDACRLATAVDQDVAKPSPRTVNRAVQTKPYLVGAGELATGPCILAGSNNDEDDLPWSRWRERLATSGDVMINPPGTKSVVDEVTGNTKVPTGTGPESENQDEDYLPNSRGRKRLTTSNRIRAGAAIRTTPAKTAKQHLLKLDKKRQLRLREREALPFLQCQHCDFRTKSEKLLQRHLTGHGTDDSPIFRCDICPRKFPDLSTAETHKLVHKVRSCPHCQEFETRDGHKYVAHLRTVHEIAIPKRPVCHPNVCLDEACGQQFPSKRAMFEHLKTVHPGQRLFPCDQCPKRYTSSSNLRAHVRSHEGVAKNHICEQCGYRTSKAGTLRKHRERHSDEKRYTCQTCGQRFKDYTSFRSHEQRHLIGDRKDHVCHFCAKAFNRASNLRTHLRIHTQERAFKCQLCPRSFNTRQGQDIHMASHTTVRTKKLSCNMCSRTYSSRQGLDLHLQTHANKRQFSCEFCARTFNHKRGLVSHLKTHKEAKMPFECVDCGRAFPQQASLSAHCRKAHVTLSSRTLEFPCPKCPRQYDKRRSYLCHLRKHEVAEKALVGKNICPLCDLRFFKHGNLKNHLRQAHLMETDDMVASE